MLGSVSLLTNPYVVSFIYDVLGKSYTWVGRLHIYAMISDVIKVHPWIGYGYFSNIVEEILGFGNAQNGVLKIIVDSGIVGLIGYALLVYRSMKSNENSSKEGWALTAFCILYDNCIDRRNKFDGLLIFPNNCNYIFCEGNEFGYQKLYRREAEYS